MTMMMMRMMPCKEEKRRQKEAISFEGRKRRSEMVH